MQVASSKPPVLARQAVLKLLDRDDQRRVATIRRPPSTTASACRWPAGCPSHAPWRPAAEPLASLRARARPRGALGSSSMSSARVPEAELADAAKLAHRLAIRATPPARSTRAPRVQSSDPDRPREARGQPHDVPLEGPGSVSSKSLTLKTSRRSGAVNPPKFERCASPQSCADRPVPARRQVAGHQGAAPRKNVNGDTSIRPCRIGTSSGTRVAPWSSSIATGSRRPGRAPIPRAAARGTSRAPPARAPSARQASDARPPGADDEELRLAAMPATPVSPGLAPALSFVPLNLGLSRVASTGRERVRRQAVACGATHDPK